MPFIGAFYLFLCGLLHSLGISPIPSPGSYYSVLLVLIHSLGISPIPSPGSGYRVLWGLLHPWVSLLCPPQGPSTASCVSCYNIPLGLYSVLYDRLPGPERPPTVIRGVSYSYRACYTTGVSLLYPPRGMLQRPVGPATNSCGNFYTAWISLLWPS